MLIFEENPLDLSMGSVRNHDTVVAVFEGLYELYHGNPDSYLAAVKKLNAIQPRPSTSGRPGGTTPLSPALVKIFTGYQAVLSSIVGLSSSFRIAPAAKVPRIIKRDSDLPQWESLFVTIPETLLPNGTLVPEFTVSRYLCTVVNGYATVSPEVLPTCNISYFDAIRACDAALLKLVRETQELAIGWNIYQVGENWSSGVVGDGALVQQVRDDPENQRSCFVLSNGVRIFDVTGRYSTWVYDDVQGDDRGLVARPFCAESPTIATVPRKPMGMGIGWMPLLPCDYSGGAIIRAGRLNVESGLFGLGYSHPDAAIAGVGFRVTLPASTPFTSTRFQGKHHDE